MRTWIHHSILACLAAIVLSASAAPAARAQQAPALTVSIASANELLGDIRYVTKIAGYEQAGDLVGLLAGQYTANLDATKPAGVIVRFDGAEPMVTGFLPVTNLPGLLQVVEAQVGKPEDAGNGVQKIGFDQPIFFKQDGNWVFLSNSMAGVAPIANPDGSITDLVKDYDIGIRANIPAIPEPLRQMAVQEMKDAFERQMEMQAAQAASPEEAEAQRAMSERALDQMVQGIEEINEVVVGLAVDQTNKNVHLDLSVTAKEGSKLAGQIAVMEAVTSSFTGFAQPNAAAVMNFASVLNKDDIEQTKAWLAVVEKQAASEIEKDDSLPDDNAKAAVKKVLSSFMGVVNKTIESGKMDGGAVLSLEDGVSFVAGGYMADGNAVADAFKDLVELAKNEPDFPEVKFNAGTHASVTFHTMSMPVPEGEEEARQALGDTVEVVLGTGEKSAFVAFGKNAMGLTKKVIDDSAAAGAKKVDPMKMMVSLGPILKFAAAMDADNPALQGVVSAIDEAQGRDSVSISLKMIPKGVSYRISVDEGVITLGAKAAGGGAPADDGF